MTMTRIEETASSLSTIKGVRRWTKAGHDRLYILGRGFEENGVYIDLTTGDSHGGIVGNRARIREQRADDLLDLELAIGKLLKAGPIPADAPAVDRPALARSTTCARCHGPLAIAGDTYCGEC